MSQNENDSKNVLNEVTRKVTITAEDVAGAAEFWPQFEVPMPPELKASFDAFCANPTVATQDELTIQLTKAISDSDHEAFNDEMFKEITEECRNVLYAMSFDKALETQLSTEED